MGCAVSAALPIPVIQLLQVLTIAIGAPGVTGVIAKVEARLQGRRGPRIRQPYYDLAERYYAQHDPATLFLRAERQPDGRRTFRLPAGEPLPTSYGEDLYQQVFGPADQAHTARA